MVADALSRKVESMGSLAFIPVEKRPLALDIQSLANRLFDDPHLAVLKETVLQGSAKVISIGKDGVLRLQGCLCVPNVDVLRETILEEAHSSWYSIHQGATKMYRDLRQHYWWRRMKKDIVEYVARCLDCQQLERIVQILEDMLRACVIDFGGQWDQALPLAEFAYNNNYQSSIEMAPFDALYDWRCRSPIG
ncbi:uncharacterized protein [Nicotiana sylvestris]|uniref:uncharacterized protein n=1 Tax=Nicotiana sylvestris TaxID=4096 RepID=UPI00388CC1AC